MTIINIEIRVERLKKVLECVTPDDLKHKWMRDPAFAEEYDRLEKKFFTMKTALKAVRTMGWKVEGSKHN